METEFNRDEIWMKLVKEFNHFSEGEIKQFEESFRELNTYELKLQFWESNKLSPIKLQYTFSLKDEETQKIYKPEMSLHPIDNDEKKLYLNWLIDRCYGEYQLNKSNYNFEAVLFENLKFRFENLKGDKRKNIESEIQLTKQRIKKANVSSDVFSYLTYKQSEPNMLSDLKIANRDLVISLQYLAIEIAFVYDFLKYLLFLDEVNVNSDAYNSPKHIPFTQKSFSHKEGIDLKSLYRLLLQNKIIGAIEYPKFENVFHEVIISDNISKDDKINWILTNGKGETNWQALFVLIYFACDNVFDNNFDADVEKKLEKCFTAPNNTFENVDSFTRAKRTLLNKENNFSTLSRNKDALMLYNYFTQ